MSLFSFASVLAVPPGAGGGKILRLWMIQSGSLARFSRGEQSHGNPRQNQTKVVQKESLCGRVSRLSPPEVKLNLRPQKGKTASEVIGGFQAVDGVDWTHGRVFREQQDARNSDFFPNFWEAKHFLSESRVVDASNQGRKCRHHCDGRNTCC